MGRREEYVAATVRLVEVEVYGDRADDDELAETVRQSLPEANAAPGAAAEPRTPGESDAIMATVLTYVEAYAQRDLDLLVQTISPQYLSDGEDADGLAERMARTFEEFGHFLFRVTDAHVERSDDSTAVVSARYWMQLNPLLARSTEGTLTFGLTRVGESWLISEMHAEAL